MNAKTYLSQAIILDQKINSQLEQLEHFKALSQKITTSYRSEKVTSSKDKSPMESAIIKLAMAEEKINMMIDSFVDLKDEISRDIEKLGNHEYKMLLELRYLCFNSWDEIARKMHYMSSYIQKLHSRALKSMDKILQEGKHNVK